MRQVAKPDVACLDFAAVELALRSRLDLEAVELALSTSRLDSRRAGIVTTMSAQMNLMRGPSCPLSSPGVRRFREAPCLDIEAIELALFSRLGIVVAAELAL